MATPASPCRLFVFLARKARTGVILRRGPSDWVQRLLRDRWEFVERGFDPRTHRRVGRAEIWEKRHPNLPLEKSGLGRDAAHLADQAP